MNILVCVKQVPDTTEIKIDPVKHTLIRDGVPSIVNPFDAYALELGVRLKEQAGGKVTVLSMGPNQAVEALKSCLAVGADAAYLASDRAFGGSDTLATSYVISCALKAIEKKTGEPFDLILCGKQAIDGDTGQVGPSLAEHLGYASLTYAVNADVVDGKLQVKREYDEGYDILEAAMPLVMTVIKTPWEPRYPTIRSRLAANRAPINVVTAADIEIELERAGLKGSPTKVQKTYTPVREKHCVTIKEESDAASALKLAGLMADTKLI